MSEKGRKTVEKTIAAISTPHAVGGISVIRISGGEAIQIADRVFRGVSGRKLEEHKGYTAAYGQVCSGGRMLDEAVALVFRAPKSYTGEDVVEKFFVQYWMPVPLPPVRENSLDGHFCMEKSA